MAVLSSSAGKCMLISARGHFLQISEIKNDPDFDLTHPPARPLHGEIDQLPYSFRLWVL